MLAGLAAQPSQTGMTCAQATDLTNVTIPKTADPSSLIAISSKTASDQEEATLPSSIISYFDSLPEIQQQFNDIPLSSCAVIPQQPELCTHVVSSTTKQCSTSTSGNLTRSICTEVTLTSVSTQTSSAAHVPINTGQVNLGRNPAAFLTYNTLTLSSEGSGLPANLLSDAIVSPTDPQHRESEYIHPIASEFLAKTTSVIASKSSSKPVLRPNVLSEPAPSEAKQSGGNGSPSQPTTGSGGSSDNQDGKGGGENPSPDAPRKSSQPVVAQPEASRTSFEDPTQSGSGFNNIQSAIAGLASQASEAKPDGGRPDGTAGPQTTSGAGIGNLWSAIQSVVSYVAAPQGPVSTIRPGETPSAERPAKTEASQQDADIGNTESAHFTDGNTAEGPEATTASVTADQVSGNTGSAHSTSGYTAEAPEHTAAVVTTDQVPVFTFLGQTLSPGDAATFGGSPISGLPSQDGVIISGSQTVHVSDGSATTIHQSGQQPVTVSRSGSVLVVNDQTLSPGQEITAGRTTASLAQSTAVLYVNGAATTLAGPSITLGGTVYNAAPGSSSTGKDLGGYIYSGIGGSVATGSSSDGAANAAVTTPPSTGAGSRSWERIHFGWATAALCALLSLY
jgi:hypothetical protein